MQMDELKKRLGAHRLLAVITIDSAEDSLPLAENLLAGGVSAVELTLRTKAAIPSIENIKKNFPDMLMGAGTVIFPEQVRQVQDAGADFALSPGISARVIERALALSLPMVPGISTASDIELALGYNLRTLKFFPAEPVGGIHYLESLQTPYSYLGMKFIPLGGINPDNITPYMCSSFILAVGGSWIATPEMIKERAWAAIRKQAESAVELLERGVRQEGRK